MDEVRVGEVVRVKDTGSRGLVREVDAQLQVARVEFPASGAERWVLLDELEVAMPWYLRGQDTE